MSECKYSHREAERVQVSDCWAAQHCIAIHYEAMTVCGSVTVTCTVLWVRCRPYSLSRSIIFFEYFAFCNFSFQVFDFFCDIFSLFCD